MERYLQEQVYPLHTPGHKGGRGMAEPLRSLLGPSALRMDVSLMSELDDIHAPDGCIKSAQEEAAKLYGSDACFMAVNGTTGAIHAMLMTALQPGDKILIPRNAHRSVMGGLILADAVPVYVQPPFIKEFGLQGQVTPEQVKEAFAKHPDLKAVLLTSPNYFGMAAHVKQIADIVHAHDAVLLVDEAHGPHLGFHQGLPPSAMQCGADMAAQSTHKILGALTQCSLLQVKGTRINLQHAADVMSLLTTTSPNYLLMGSLDAARAQLAERGPSMMEDALHAARILRNELQKIPGLQVIGPEQVVGKFGVAALDLTKV
ncbi:MAG: aminotransferase class I/II-fold pyridoxal phosphate-dependent enzyme, partial [Acidaminococcaceae bacterium]|nr:aminotransferase class I/II-fold pyridoxal phosphate-dependent enzyme [Acidaminococcaceae bacterium]